MLKIYGFARVNKGARGNTRDLRVLWGAEEMGLSYGIVGMDHPNHDLEAYCARVEAT
jgi:glutathione S-transferase